MSLVLAAALTAVPAALPACSWDRPGHNPFMGDVVSAVDRYQDIPAATRAKLKARMAARQYDEIVDIRRDAIVGKARYGHQIQDMHFGAGQVCGTVSRAKWSADAHERGLVYCEDGQCILVPTVCRNVSRIQREAAPAGPALADLAPGGGGNAGGPGGGALLGPGGAGPAVGSGVAGGPGAAEGAPTTTAAATNLGDLPAAQNAGDSFAGVAGLGSGGVASGLAGLGGGAAGAGAVLLAAAGDTGGAGSPGFNWDGGGDAPWLGGGPTNGPAGAVLVPGAGGTTGGTGLDTGGGLPAIPPVDSGVGSLFPDVGGGGIIGTDPGAVVAVPEPASALLLLLGLAGLLAWRRRQAA